MKRIVRKEEGLLLTCLLPEGQERQRGLREREGQKAAGERERQEGRMESGAEDPRPGLIYFHGAQNGLPLPEELLEAANTACVCIAGEDWNRDLTPWPAERVFQKGEDFGGGADAYLALLTEKIIPHTEEALSAAPRFRALAGVSLAGLFSVYAAYRTDLFDRIVSISGSLWYDGAAEYFQSHPLNPAVRRVYLSLGTAEEKARNPRMARVGDCTREIHQLLKGHGVSCTLEWNPGGHFREIPERFLRAIDWLCGQSF